MAWSPEISQLSTDLNQLTDAVNVKKNLLNTAVTSTQNSKIATNISAGISANSAILSAASTQIANTHKNSTLSIYGTQSAQQTSVGTAASQAANAATLATTMIANLTQDLSGVTSQALHRSPNAISSMFVYDTSKDSDGGAWSEKCQHTSWYNETIYNKWLGAHDLENNARFTNCTSGNELLTNGYFSNGLTGWTTTGATVNVIGNVAYISALSNNVRQSISQTFATVIGATYRLTYRLVSGGGGNTHVYVGNSYASAELGSGPILVGNRTVIFTASSTTTFLTIGVWGILETLAVTDVSLRQVISTTTASGDYYQLTTDGKFYRMRRNKFTFTESFVAGNYFFPRPALGGINGTLAGTTFTASTRFGNINMCNVTSTAGTAEHGIYVCTNTFGVIGADWPGMPNATFSCIIKRGTSDYIILRQYSSTPFVEAKFNLNTLAITKTSNFASIEDLGGGLFRLSISHSYIGGGRQNWHIKGTDATGNATFNGDGTVMFAVSALQLESGDAHTDYEAVLGINEIFRGNKRDFPRIAGIVAEGTNVNIYDLTEPGRPMWMRFIATATATITAKNMLVGASANAIVAQNAKLVVGGPVTNLSGLNVMDFARDSAELRLTSGYSWQGNISTRNGTGGYGAVDANIPGIVSGFVGTVAITVLPDAPIDPVTGLRVPTIWAAQNGGISRIGHNGLVTNTTSTGWAHQGSRLEIIGNDIVQVAGNDPSYNWNLAWPSSALMNTNSRPWAPSTVFGRSNVYNAGWALCDRGYALSGPRGTGLVALVETNAAAPVKGLEAIIGSTYNTGWLAGDIRRTYLSDVNVGTVTGPDLVVNGTFDTDTTGWTTYGSGAASTIAAVSGVAQWTVSAGASYPGVSTQISGLTVGRTYRISWLYSRTSGGDTSEFRIATSNTLGGGLIASVSNPAAGVLGNIQFIATTISVFIGQFAIANPTVGSVHTFDNISVREVISDRSYKAQIASINGTLTRSQVASGTSLVGYSGFSTANYLQEPYSPDLDFGTGEFSASAWVNIPVAMSTSSFPVISSELISGNPTLTVGATFSTGVVTVTGSVGSSGSWLLSGHTAGKVYRVTFNVLEVQSSGNSANIRVGVAGNEGLYNVISIPTTGIKIVYFVATSGNAPKITFQRSDPAVGQTRIGTISVIEVGPAIIFDRSMSSGTRIRYGIIGTGVLTAEAFDGTATRTVTTTATYNTAQWLKAEVNYTTDGSLGIRVNGREVAVTRGNPLGNMTFGKNLLPYSNTLTPWSKGNSTVTNPNIITPDGTIQTVSLYKDSIGTTAQSVSYDIGVAYATQVITVSVYVKRIDSDYFSIQISEEYNYQNLRAAFNITDAGYGLVNTFGTVTTSITPAGNGWFRVTMSGQSNNNNNAKVFFTLSNSVSGTSRVYAYNYTATGKSVYIYGAQAEVGSSATSFTATNVAPLTIGNSFTTNAPFPGSIALLKLGTIVPTPEQSIFMHDQEKQLFRPGALSVLPDANAIVDMSYDDATGRWAAVSTTNKSYWNGLVRSSVTAVPAGSYSKVATTSGIELVSRITTNPGVDVSIPPYALREELVKKSETAIRLVRKTVIYDYVGGFTGNITTGSTSILSIAGLTYPTSYIGARISGTGIPANTVITGVSGTTLYISAPATATTATLTITFLDFILPAGMEAKVVLTAGVIRREGSTFDYTRLFDGFIETIRFAVAPGSTAWVQIQATRTIQ